MIEHYRDEDLSFKYAHRFGEIAINMGFVNSEQVQEALAEQTIYYSSISTGHLKLIGEILFENGLMTLQQIERVVDEISRFR